MRLEWGAWKPIWRCMMPQKTWRVWTINTCRRKALDRCLEQWRSKRTRTVESQDIKENRSGTGVTCPPSTCLQAPFPCREGPFRRISKQDQVHSVSEAFGNQTSIHHVTYLPFRDVISMSFICSSAENILQPASTPDRHFGCNSWIWKTCPNDFQCFKKPRFSEVDKTLGSSEGFW